MIKALQVSLDSDLSQLTRLLWKLKVNHRVIFEDAQILVVQNTVDAEFVVALYQRWCENGAFSTELIDQYKELTGKQQKANNTIKFKEIPLVLLLLICSLIVSLVLEFGDNRELLSYFTITHFQLLGNTIHYTTLQHNVETYQFWRFISPIFIHFNIMHLVFNALWIWIVASVIERKQGSFILLLLVLFSGIGSNVGQYFTDGPVFGGLSGVVYAVLTYAWLWDKLVVNKDQNALNIVSNPLMSFMTIWLVLGYTDVLSNLGFGDVANTAHLLGMIVGALAVPSILLGQQLLRSKQSN